MVILILVLLLIFVAYLLTQRLRLKLYMTLNGQGFAADIFCLYPLVKIHIELEHSIPYLYVYLFKIRVYKSRLIKNKKTRKKLGLIKNVDVKDINVDTFYGLKNPYLTAIASGVIGAAKHLTSAITINHYPDFNAVNEYLRIEASGYLSLGNTIRNYAKNNIE